MPRQLSPLPKIHTSHRRNQSRSGLGRARGATPAYQTGHDIDALGQRFASYVDIMPQASFGSVRG